MIKLSLIVATYNRAEALLTALESVVHQSAPAEIWECVVINNNSKDNTIQRFETFTAQHPLLNIRLVTETNQGLSHARNRGIAETTGEYIAIIDDDERINPDFIRAYIDFFDAHPGVASAGGRIIPEYPCGRPSWLSKYTEIPIANPICLGDKVQKFPAGHIPGGGNMALRRSIIGKYGAFNTSLGRTGTKLVGGEESDLFERLSGGGEQCWYVPTAVMWHIIPPEKLTKEYFERLCFNIGITQKARAIIENRVPGLYAAEGLKWCVTIFLAGSNYLRLQFGRGAYLLRMRWQISRGILAH